MIKKLLEKRGSLAKRLSEIQAIEALTPELRSEVKTVSDELAAIGVQIEERKAMQATLDTASQPVNFTAPKADEPVIRASTPRDLEVYTAKRFGSAHEAGRQAYNAGQWLMASLRGSAKAAEYCRQNGMELRTLNEGDNASAGSLVPSPLSNTIIELINEYGVARRFCGKEVMTSDQLTISKRTGGLTAYWVGESGSITASNQTYKPVGITAKKLAALVKYSSEVNEDSIVALADKIMMETGVAFATSEDDAVFNGTGTSAYGGIVGLINSAAAGAIKAQTSLTSAATCTDAFVMTAIAAVAPYARQKVIFANPYFQNAVFTRLARAAGGALLTEVAGIGMLQQYAGIPIVPTNVLPTTDSTGAVYAIVGDLRQAVAWGDRRSITFKRLVERYADTDEEAIQATERFGVTVHDVGTSSIAGAYVVCKLG